MMMKDKVSACIITYNQEDYIKDCLDGAINQVLDYDYEIVIGDDCSTDNTLKICKEYAAQYPDKIRLLVRDKNKGMTGNWMDTIQNCQGKYIALCEGDDYWTDNYKLQKQVDFLNSNPDYVLCFHKVDVLKPDGTITEDFITKLPENHETIEDMATFGNYIHTPSVVYRNIINDFPSEFEKTPIADFFLYMLLGENGKFKNLSDKMCVYRHGVGIFTSQTDFKVNLNVIELFSRLLSSLKDEKIKKIILERQIQILNRFAKNYRLVNKNNKSNIIKNAIKKLLIFKIK